MARCVCSVNLYVMVSKYYSPVRYAEKEWYACSQKLLLKEASCRRKESDKEIER